MPKSKIFGDLHVPNSVVSSAHQEELMRIYKQGKNQQAFAILKPIWRSKALKTSTKIRIFNSNVKSVLLYESETWRSTFASIKPKQVFLNRWLRNILAIKWPEKTCNLNLWQSTKQEMDTQTITTRKWICIDHTLRKGNTNITRHDLELKSSGPQEEW